MSSRLFFDLSVRVKLRVSGADRIRFLNGQLTNDIKKVTETKAVEACVLNPKGKMDAHLFLHTKGDSFILDADPDLAPILQPRLERYIIADDVVIEDLTARLSILHTIGEPVPRIPAAADVISVNRFGLNGHDIWIDAAQHDELVAEFSEHFAFCDDNCADLFRIEQGIPRWGRELTNEIIPVEASLEARCIDYEKGCYIGQETISRMKMSGQRNKRLCGLISVNGPPLSPGMKLFPMGDEKKQAGWITSADQSRRLGKQIALGYVKRPYDVVGANLDALDSAEPSSSAAIRVEIVDLPFSGPLLP